MCRFEIIGLRCLRDEHQDNSTRWEFSRIGQTWQYELGIFRSNFTVSKFPLLNIIHNIIIPD